MSKDLFNEVMNGMVAPKLIDNIRDEEVETIFSFGFDKNDKTGAIVAILTNEKTKAEYRLSQTVFEKMHIAIGNVDDVKWSSDVNNSLNIVTLHEMVNMPGHLLTKDSKIKLVKKVIVANYDSEGNKEPRLREEFYNGYEEFQKKLIKINREAKANKSIKYKDRNRSVNEARKEMMANGLKNPEDIKDETKFIYGNIYEVVNP